MPAGMVRPCGPALLVEKEEASLNLAEILLVWLVASGGIVLLYWIHTLGWQGVVLAAVLLGGVFTGFMYLAAAYIEKWSTTLKQFSGEDQN